MALLVLPAGWLGDGCQQGSSSWCSKRSRAADNEQPSPAAGQQSRLHPNCVCLCAPCAGLAVRPSAADLVCSPQGVCVQAAQAKLQESKDAKKKKADEAGQEEEDEDL